MKLYRYSPSNLSGPLGDLTFIEFKVVRTTPQGAWIYVYGAKKFVLLTACKRYACITKREAVESFIARKRRHLRILEAQVSCIIPILKTAEIQLEKMNKDETK